VNFLTGVQDERIVLTRYDDGSGGDGHPFRNGYYPIDKPIQTILAEYFEINLNEIEGEKRAMLDELRAANARR
jgi:hypothetical protein